MELFFKTISIITTVLLLLVCTLHPVHLQDTLEPTDIPRRTIAPGWLRLKFLREIPNVQPQETAFPLLNDQVPEESGVESGTDPSGYEIYATEGDPNGTIEYATQPSIYNETTLAPVNQDSNVSTTTQLPNVGETNVTDTDIQSNQTVSEDTEEIPFNSTTAPSNTTTGTQTTMQAPEIMINGTGTTEVDSGEGTTMEVGNNFTSTSAPAVPESTQQDQSNEPMTSNAPATALPTAPPEATTPPETTRTALATPGRANVSDKGGERGFASETEKRQRKGAWGAVLGTFVAIAVVGLVAYVILKKKHHKAFSHRKLEEDFPSDPVLRLDNSEPLDLNFGRAAYYNPGLQADNIQMSPFPKN